jgi:2-keto-4-pentenoate hydratase/2-oxohepta-3-ene-1,7-dioic acid hydratase in catechol pathway
MKLALFDDYRPGVINGNEIVDISDLVGADVLNQEPQDRMPELMMRFDTLHTAIAARAVQPGKLLTAVRLRAPLPRPAKMLFGLGNYREGIESPTMPLNMFVKSSRSVLDPGGTVELIPQDPFVFHHEGELAVVIGRRTRKVSPTQAMDSVFGYTCIVDVSARGFMGSVNFINKSPDTFCPMGPWIATRDEVPDPQNLSVKLWVDARLRQDYPTSDMEHPVAEIVSWASQILTLEPGDVLACGVNHQGLGPVQDGEIVRIEIERIGSLSARIHDAKRRKWPAGVDQGMARAARMHRRGEPLPPPMEMFVQRID